MDKPTAGMRKRQRISQANRVMFLWVAAMSVVVGISVVLTIFLAQKIWFGEKVIAEKNKTASVLDKNLSVVDELKDNIRVLNTNEALASTKLKDSDPAIQSVLDALPANANSTALASSLQTKLLAGIPGVQVDAITVTPVGSEALAGSVSSQDTSSNEIGFTFSVSTDINNYGSLIQVLTRLEKSIRPLNVKTASIETQAGRVSLVVSGVSYYQPAQIIQLSQKVVKP